MSTIKRIFVDVPQEHPIAAVRRHFAAYTQSGGHLTSSSGLGAAWDALNPLLLVASSRAQLVLDAMTGGKTSAICIAWSFSTSPDRGTATLAWSTDRRVLRFRFLQNKAQMQTVVPNTEVAGSFKPTGMCVYLPTFESEGVLGVLLESPYAYIWDDMRPLQHIDILHKRFLKDRLEDLQETMSFDDARELLGISGRDDEQDTDHEPVMSRSEAMRKLAGALAERQAAAWDSIMPVVQAKCTQPVRIILEQLRLMDSAVATTDGGNHDTDPLRTAYDAASPPVQAAVNVLLGYTPQ